MPGSFHKLGGFFFVCIHGLIPHFASIYFGICSQRLRGYSLYSLDFLHVAQCQSCQQFMQVKTTCPSQRDASGLREIPSAKMLAICFCREVFAWYSMDMEKGGIENSVAFLYYSERLRKKCGCFLFPAPRIEWWDLSFLSVPPTAEHHPPFVHLRVWV